MPSKYKQGIYIPVNHKKYIVSEHSLDKGDYPFCRSSWETKACKYFDMYSGVKKWSSEPFPIQYFNPIKNRVARYFPDFYAEVLVDDKIKRCLIEVKPMAETKPPKIPKRKTAKSLNRYKKALETYAVNSAKWKAAEEFCRLNNLEWIIMTERELG